MIFSLGLQVFKWTVSQCSVGSLLCLPTCKRCNEFTSLSDPAPSPLESQPTCTDPLLGSPFPLAEALEHF